MTDEELIAEARRAGYLLRRCSGDVDRLAGWLLAELAGRLDAHAAQVSALRELAARWQSFGDGEDAQSECAAELRETIGGTDAVAASIEQQSAYRNELRHLPGYMTRETTPDVPRA